MTLAPMETTPEQQMGAQLAAGSRLNLSSEACPEQTATAECAAEQVSQGHRKGRRQNVPKGVEKWKRRKNFGMDPDSARSCES